MKLIRKYYGLAVKVIHDDGYVGLFKRSFNKLSKLVPNSRSAQLEIDTKANINDILSAKTSSAIPNKWRGTTKKSLTFTWVMPPPGKGSGGHMTIFRFIKYLENAGHVSNIYLYAKGGSGPVKHIQAIMRESFPVLNATKSMKWLTPTTTLAPTDAVFATSWETAYPVHNSAVKAKKFYFVQDFEPYFYAVGSHYYLAENTYKLGMHGITAGGWLSDKLAKEYGMKTDYFDFGSDSDIYTYKNGSSRKEVFLYVRPFTERRGFEIGIMALVHFHEKHPNYKINIFGWDVSNYNIPFPYMNLGILEKNELNNLYNRCAAGLVLSFTNMSLLPLEVLSAGAIPIVNDGMNNRMVSNNKYIKYADSDPYSIGEALSEIVSMKNLPVYSKKASASASTASWDESGARLVKILEDAVRNGDD